MGVQRKVNLPQPQILTAFIPSPFLITFLSHFPSIDASSSTSDNLYAKLKDAELAEIIKNRFDPNRRSQISAVFGEPDFLPISFLELGIKQAAAVCRIVRSFSDEASGRLINEIRTIEKDWALGEPFKKEELAEIFSMSELGENFAKSFFAQFKDFEDYDETRPTTALRLPQFKDLMPIPIGTGFLVGNRYLLTNYHVIPTREVARECIYQFGYEQDVYGRTIESIDYEVDESFFWTSPKLDYTLVKLKEEPKERKFKGLGKAGNVFTWIPMDVDRTNVAPPLCERRLQQLKKNFDLPRELGKTLLGDPVNIIQHPKGKRKQIALSNNRMLDLNRSFLQYEADADFSSSGSPVFNQQWQLIGLHHAAIPKIDEEEIDEEGNRPIIKEKNGRRTFEISAQEGVRICQIVEDMKTRAMQTSPPTDALAEEILNFIDNFVNQPNDPAREIPDSVPPYLQKPLFSGKK